MNLRQSLFVPVNKKFWKMLQMARYEFECFCVIVRQLDLFPQVFWSMSSFCGLQEQVAIALFFPDSRITAVGERASTSRMIVSLLIRFEAISSQCCRIHRMG